MDFSFLFSPKKYVDVSDKLEYKKSFNTFSNIIIKSDLQVKINGKSSDSSPKLFLKNSKDVNHVFFIAKVLDNDTIEISCSTNEKIKGYIEIYIPKLKSLKVNTLTADIQILHTFVKFIQIFSESGDINISDSKFEEIFFKTQDGDITMFLLDCSYNISLDTKFGDITKNIKNKASASKKISCQTINGDIHIEKTK